MATIKEIAEAAGVSVGTVDRILHNRGRFSAKTAEKVNQLVKDMGYTPNIHARGLKKSTKHTFSVVLPQKDQDGGYWEFIEEGVIKGFKELQTYGTNINIYNFDRFSTVSCINAFKEAFEDESIGIISAPVIEETIKELLENQEKPFIFVDSDIPAISRKISYIGQDSRQSGLLSAKLMCQMVSSKRSPKILILDPYGEDYHLSERITGFINGTEKRQPKAQITIEKTNYGYNEDSIINILNKYKSYDGVFVANSLVYNVASIMKGLGEKFTSISLIGYDLIPDKADFIGNEIIDYIITQEPIEQGYKSVHTLYDSLILKKDVPESIIIPMNIITKENLSTFIS